MTHGEMWFEATRAKEELNLDKNGYCREVGGLPKRMGRAEAGIYYNSKLFEHWRDKLDIASRQKEKALAFLMFKTLEPKFIKLKKELINAVAPVTKP